MVSRLASKLWIIYYALHVVTAYSRLSARCAVVSCAKTPCPSTFCAHLRCAASKYHFDKNTMLHSVSLYLLAFSIYRQKKFFASFKAKSLMEGAQNATSGKSRKWSHLLHFSHVSMFTIRIFLIKRAIAIGEGVQQLSLLLPGAPKLPKRDISKISPPSRWRRGQEYRF